MRTALRMVGLVLCLIGRAASAQSTGTDGAASAGSTPSGAQTSAPSGGFFSSLTQALRQDLTYDVVRGHVDVGSPPSAHRLYCLLDTRTGKNEVNAVTGEPFVRPDGMTGIKSGAVSPLSCVTAEQQGTLVTAGYVLNVTPKDTTNVPATAPPAYRRNSRIIRLCRSPSSWRPWQPRSKKLCIRARRKPDYGEPDVPGLWILRGNSSGHGKDL